MDVPEKKNEMDKNFEFLKANLPFHEQHASKGVYLDQMVFGDPEI